MIAPASRATMDDDARHDGSTRPTAEAEVAVEALR